MMHVLKCLAATLGVGLLAAPLAACQDPSATSVRTAALVRTAVVQPRDVRASVTLTGAVQARFQADLSFRVSGRVVERLVEVGGHVQAGDVLARLDPTEQQADVDATTAALASAEAQLRIARTSFERQKALVANGFTTRTAFDQAQEDLRTAEASLETGQAQLGTAKDALGYTELRADAAGLITARHLEVGQVVQAAQPVFTLAHDGDREVVFDVAETIFFEELDGDHISLKLVSSPDVSASGHVREVSPALDPKGSSVRVKVAIENPPAAMTLGSAVAGTARSNPSAQIAVPWTALSAKGLKPAVWLVDQPSKTVSLRPVAVAGYEADSVLIKSGLAPGDRIVIDGGKLLSSGQPVTFDGGRS